MNCNDFKFPIISVTLLENEHDILYHIPANAIGHDYISVGDVDSDLETYATIMSQGERIIANEESFKLSDVLSTKQGAHYQKVTLEYETSTIFCDNLQELNSQQLKLKQNFYSLLVEFFDGTFAIIRCLSHGDGYLFSSKEQDGIITNTITITNLTGLQTIVS